MTGPADGMIPRLKEQLDAAMRRPAQPTELKSARVPLELTAGVITTKPLLIETPQGRAATSLRVDLPAASIAGEWRIERLTVANVIGTSGKCPRSHCRPSPYRSQARYQPLRRSPHRSIAKPSNARSRSVKSSAMLRNSSACAGSTRSAPPKNGQKRRHPVRRSRLRRSPSTRHHRRPRPRSRSPCPIYRP